MKRKLLNILMVGILTTMTACNRWSTTDEPHQSEELQQDNKAVLLEQATFEDSRYIQLGSPYDGALATVQKFDTDTIFFYSEVDSGQKYGFPILYTTTPDGGMTPYCNKEGCQHNDAFCNAYSETCSGQLFTAQGKPYFFQQSYLQRNPETGMYETIERPALFGISPEGMKQLCWFDKTYDTQWNYSIVVAGNRLYSPIKEENGDVALSCIELESGKVRHVGKLFEYERDIPALHMVEYMMPSGEIKDIAGQCGEINLLAVSDDGNYVVFSQNIKPTLTSSGLYERKHIKVLSLYNNTVTTLQSCDAAYPSSSGWGPLESMDVYDGYIYKNDSEKGQFERIKIGGDTWETVYDYSGKDWKKFEAKYYDGNKIICWAMLNNQKICYQAIIIDLDTMEASENTVEIKDSFFYYPHPIVVFDQSPDYLLIRTENTMDMQVDLAMMSKADYYANKASWKKVGHIKAYS